MHNLGIATAIYFAGLKRSIPLDLHPSGKAGLDSEYLLKPYQSGENRIIMLIPIKVL